MQLAGMSLSRAAFNTMAKRFTTRILTGFFLLPLLIAGCSTNSPAPITDIHSSTPSAPQTAGVTEGSYTVQAGDTLFKIAQQHGTSVQNVAQRNAITDPSQLRVGQVLVIAQTTTVAAATPTPPTSTAITNPVTDVPPSPVVPPVTETVTPAASAVATDSPRASDANLISWGWPTSGTIIQSFTASTKGIDLAGTTGDPIMAAASGKVMYAGNGVRGLGNLILLGHSNGFITAYAHNETLLVKTGQEIQKGQKIATLGQSDTSSPRLHFEIRRRGTPVNPMSYLPSR